MQVSALALIVSITLIQAPAALSTSSESDNRGDFWAPKEPSKAYYRIECSIDPSKGHLEGKELIRFKNTTARPIRRLAIKWLSEENQALEIAIGDKAVSVSKEPGSDMTLIELSEALACNEQIDIEVKFSVSRPDGEHRGTIALIEWYPRLWWGFETHGDFDVKIDVPPGYKVATGGVLNSESGYYHAEGVRNFGLVLLKDVDVIDAKQDDVVVKCYYRAKGKKCAELLLDTAVDVINFYRERFGFYPHSSLTIVPGMDRPAGGYPVATNIVAVHGMERMSEESELHWRWITAHEIGHQYWLEYVLSKDPVQRWGWLMIGLGIYADREYVRARGWGLEKHRELMGRYTEGVREGLDTTVNVSEEEASEIKFDFNNVVIHGKGYSIISALDCVLGKDVFDKVYRRCLNEFGGRRLGVPEFQAVCEEESGQDLGWFFQQWLNSNRYLSYEISSKNCERKGDTFISEAEVKRLGDLRMPVPVAAVFEDGGNQVKFSNRFLDRDVLRFESKSPLNEVRLDPENALALIVPPPFAIEQQLSKEVRELPWTGAGQQALNIFERTEEAGLSNSRDWFKLGLALYDGKYYAESLKAFHSVEVFTEQNSTDYFISKVWQGHILDLLGERSKAVACYKEALKCKQQGYWVRHDQYGIVIDCEWVKQRIERPFTRDDSPKNEETEAHSNLNVLDIKFEPIRQGKNVVRVKVQNTSDEDQTFRMQIYTRSPDYGRRGVGWGTSFFETIEGREAKWTRFAFKIQGPITDATYIRLDFHNPAPAASFDLKKWLQKEGRQRWFKRIKYASTDLQHHKADEVRIKPASKSQAQGVTKAFERIQTYIKDEEYDQAWQLFTKDYQDAEFQLHGLENFKRIMNPSRPIDSAFWWEKEDFLKLQPASVVKKNGVLTLQAASENQQWSIDFISENGQWKIDWIAGYTPRALQWQNWEQHVLPRMEKRGTEHFDIYYFKDSTAEREIDQIAEQKDKGFREICRFLDRDSDIRIRMVLFEDGQTKHAETGHQGMGWAYGSTIVEVHNEQERLDPYHETTHVLMRPFGSPPALFNEGFAVYMSERLGAHALEDLSGGLATIYERVRELKRKGEWIELEELITYTEIGSRESRPPVAYAEAASFVKFLIDKYGKDKFLQTYKNLRNSDDKTVQRKNIKALQQIYGKSLSELETEWEDAF